MIRRLYHPPWTHIPAASALGVIIYGAPRTIRPTRGEAVSPFDNSLVGLAIGVGLSLFFIALSVFIDELWARQESRKTFNWMSLFDEVTIGLLGGIELGQIRMLSVGGHASRFPWIDVLIVTGLVTAFAVLLELLRPYQPHDEVSVPTDGARFESELGRHLKLGRQFAYWDVQNPPWMTALITMTAVALIAGGAISWATVPYVSIVELVAGCSFLLLYSGLRVLVTRDRILVRLGVFGIRLLSLNLADITDVRLHSFSPLRDFGGYGIRFNREMRAYFFRGNAGVKVTVSGGKKFLIGSDHPSRLLAVIRAAKADSSPA